MCWLNGNRMSVVLIVVVAAMVFCGGIAKADFTFGEPTNLGPTINTSSGDNLDCVSYDSLEMYLERDSGGYGGWDIWVSTRETIADDWGAPVNLGPTVNTSQDDICAVISTDGLELYFGSNRPDGCGSYDIWVTRRPTKADGWGAPVNLGSPVNTSALEGSASISSDGLELYFDVGATRSGGYGSDDIWVSRRATKDEPWGEPMNLGPTVNSPASECYPFLSADGLLLFFSEAAPGAPLRPGGFGNVDMWMTRRASVSTPWGTPVNLGPIVNTSSVDGVPRISPDGSILYFASERPGGYGGEFGDIWQAPILPVVDFNGDGRVDGVEFTKLADYWGEYEPSCDIGPTPLGDGIIDVEDLIVLSEYIGKDVNDPSLMAHWALDETEGSVAHDSAGENDAEVMGSAMWQPTDNAVNGALLMDGVDDCVATEYVRDPSEGPLSIVAWIKGGAPGQVVISQILGANWLMVDSSSGHMMTDLKESGRSGKALLSDIVITDGNWHRVGLVWDGTHRCLYVDDVMVATDAQAGLSGSGGGLLIGCDKNMTVGTFWAGMIDDVRIYNRAVKP